MHYTANGANCAIWLDGIERLVDDLKAKVLAYEAGCPAEPEHGELTETGLTEYLNEAVREYLSGSIQRCQGVVDEADAREAAEEAQARRGWRNISAWR